MAKVFKSGLNEIHSATIEPTRHPHDGGRTYTAYLWGEFGRSSVLAGQTLRAYFGETVTVEELRERLQARFPGLDVREVETPTLKPSISTGHLPGPEDNVPGGSLPDDIGEWPPRP